MHHCFLKSFPDHSNIKPRVRTTALKIVGGGQENQAMSHTEFTFEACRGFSKVEILILWNPHVARDLHFL